MFDEMLKAARAWLQGRDAADIARRAGVEFDGSAFRFESLGVPLRDLKPRKGVLISAITRGEKTLIPNGSTTIESGDHAVVIAPAGMLRDINDIMGGER